MQFYDFEGNWRAFVKVLHSPRITKLLKAQGLTHPLYKCAWEDAVRDHIISLAQDDDYYMESRDDFISEFINENKQLLGSELDRIPMENRFDYLSDTCPTFGKSVWEFLESYIEDVYFQPQEMCTNVPVGRCHLFAVVLFEIAKELHPDRNWVLLEGDKHSTVYTLDGNILFDLTLYYLQREGQLLPKISVDDIYRNVNGDNALIKKDRPLFNSECNKTYSHPTRNLIKDANGKIKVDIKLKSLAKCNSLVR